MAVNAASHSSNIEYAVQAAQRRVHASTGPLSVSDIKKRKERQQLMQKLGKKQKSLPTDAAGMPPLGPSTAASRTTPSAATLLTPGVCGASADAARRTSVFSTASAQPESAARGSVAATPLNRTTSAGAACSQSPVKAAAQHGSPGPKERQPLPEVGRPGAMPPMSPGGNAVAGSAVEVKAAVCAEEPKRGLSSLLQITQHAAAQQVRQRRETLPVPWQVAEVSLEEACKMMDAARRGVRFHPEVRDALEAAIAHVRSAAPDLAPDLGPHLACVPPSCTVSSGTGAAATWDGRGHVAAPCCGAGRSAVKGQVGLAEERWRRHGGQRGAGGAGRVAWAVGARGNHGPLGEPHECLRLLGGG